MKNPVQDSYLHIQNYLKEFDAQYNTETKIIFSNTDAARVESNLPTGARITIESTDVLEAMSILLRICGNF